MRALHSFWPLVLFPVLLLPFPSLAQDTARAPAAHPLTLAELLPSLASSQDRILSAAARADAAGFALRRAVAARYPELTFLADGGWEYIDRPGEDEIDLDEDVSRMWRNSQTLRLRQMITDFGATAGSIGRAGALSEQARLAFEALRHEVLLAGVDAYLGVYKTAIRLGYARRSEENIRRQTGMEETLVEKGAGLSSDVLQARSQLADATARRIAAEGGLANAASVFNAVFQMELSPADLERLVLPPVPEHALPLSLDNAVNMAIARNPGLKSAEMSLDAAEAAEKASRSLFYPRIDFVADGRRRQNEVGISGVREEFRAMGELRWNLYRGGGDAAALNESKSTVEQIRRALLNERRQVERRVRVAWQDYFTATENLIYLEKQVEHLSEFLELARKERRLGTRTLLDVLTGEISYINALNNALSAKAERVGAAYELLFATGMLDSSMLN
jgi:TolC family type I secretion outer membrane protein